MSKPVFQVSEWAAAELRRRRQEEGRTVVAIIDRLLGKPAVDGGLSLRDHGKRFREAPVVDKEWRDDTGARLVREASGVSVAELSHRMAYIQDLAPYAYFPEPEPEPYLAVGWLSAEEPYTQGETSAEFRAALANLPTSKRTRGWHNCPFCPREGIYNRDANGTCEIRVRHGGVSYAAPVLIRHYVEAHGYRPPEAFIDAVLHGEAVTERAES
jgi:hypothetical protein